MSQVVKALIQVWRIMDYICGKRLAPVLGEIVERLQRHNELRCDAATEQETSANECRHYRSALTTRAAEVSIERAQPYAAWHSAEAPDPDAHFQ